jgi:hypothetical protein
MAVLDLLDRRSGGRFARAAVLDGLVRGLRSCGPCVARQLSNQDQNAHDAPEITFTEAGAWAWRNLRNEKVRGSSPLSSISLIVI